MKRILTIVVCAIMQIATLKAQTLMQQEFEKFIAKFPKKEWSDLKTITNINKEELKNFPKLQADEANRNIWYEDPQFGPENIYNHIIKEYTVVDRMWSLSAPVIMLSDGKYKTCYRRNLIGGYSDICENEIYAVARLEPFEDVIMLAIGYKYLNSDCNCYKYAIDLYSFQRSTQQMCSAVEILCPKNHIALLQDNYTIHSFEIYETMEDDECERYVYHFEPDGFLHQTEGLTDVNFVSVKISDTDGYVNVRKEPNSKSEILYTIPDETYAKVWYVPNSNWAEILWMNDNSRHKGGFIHISRVKDIKK